jgi:SAM-dependent methyltransferase
MPLTPGVIERFIFLDLNFGPGPLMDVFSAIGFRSVWAASNLGVFDALEKRPQSAAALARTLGTDARATLLLLRALDALGYVERKGSRYANTAMTRKWMLPDSATSMAGGVDFWGTTLETLWTRLEQSIRDGRPEVDFYGWLAERPATSEAFQEWLAAVARTLAGEIVARVRIPSGALRLLDAGGGHGYYSSAFCRRHPRLSATVLDFPSALVVAQRVIASEKMEHAVTLAEGDLLRDPFGSDYDVVLLFNVVHGHSPEQNIQLLRKASNALNPGGRVIILDQLAGKAPTRTIEAMTNLFALAFFQLVGAQTYTFKQVAGWLAEVSFVRSRQMRLFSSPGSSLVIATKGDS